MLHLFYTKPSDGERRELSVTWRRARLVLAWIGIFGMLALCLAVAHTLIDWMMSSYP
jgi:hypothetical protein